MIATLRSMVLMVVILAGSVPASARECDIQAMIDFVDDLCDPQGGALIDREAVINAHLCKREHKNTVSIRLRQCSRLTGQDDLIVGLKLGYGLGTTEALGHYITEYLQATNYIHSDAWEAAVLEYNLFDSLYLGCGRSGSCFNSVIESVYPIERMRLLSSGLYCDFGNEEIVKNASDIYELNDYPLCRNLYCQKAKCDPQAPGEGPFILSPVWDKLLTERYGDAR